MLQIVKKKSYILAVLVVFMSMTCCMAAEETAPSVKKLIATRAEVSPVIDGKLDDACWAVAAKADGFSVYQIPKRLHPGKKELIFYQREPLGSGEQSPSQE